MLGKTKKALAWLTLLRKLATLSNTSYALQDNRALANHKAFTKAIKLKLKLSLSAKAIKLWACIHDGKMILPLYMYEEQSSMQ